MFDKPILFLATSNQVEARIFYQQKIGLSFVSIDPYALVFNVGEFELRIHWLSQLQKRLAHHWVGL